MVGGSGGGDILVAPLPRGTEVAYFGPMAAALRVLIADPDDLVAEGMRVRLAQCGGHELVAHAHHGKEALDLIPSSLPDLILLEVSMPVMDGIDTMRAIHQAHPEQLVLAHSALTEIEYVNSMLVEGAAGYLLKGGAVPELQEAIDQVMAGERYLSPAVRDSIETGYAYTDKRPDGEYVGLTEREREIIRLIAMEKTNGEIAATLFISEDTVKTHRKRLMTKLNVRSAAGLVKYAIDRRWV